MRIIFPAESGDQKDRKEPRAEDIEFADLDKAQQAEWLRCREFLGQQINNFVHPIVLDEVAYLTKELVRTPAGKYEGGCNNRRSRPICRHSLGLARQRGVFLPALYPDAFLADSRGKSSFRLHPCPP